MTHSIWIIILAAGHSERMGVPKTLLPVRGLSLKPFKKWVEERVNQEPAHSCEVNENDEGKNDVNPGERFEKRGIENQKLAKSAFRFFQENVKEGKTVRDRMMSKDKIAGSLSEDLLKWFLEEAKEIKAGQDSMLYSISEKAVKVGLPVAVVLGEGRKTDEEILNDLAVELVHSDKETSKLSDSLRTAIQFSMRKRAEAVVIVLGDQPEIDSTVIQKVVQTYRNHRPPIVQAFYTEGPGHPVLFDKCLFTEILKVKGDQGARAILRKNKSNIHWVKTDKEVPVDLDTAVDYVNFIIRQS